MVEKEQRWHEVPIYLIVGKGKDAVVSSTSSLIISHFLFICYQMCWLMRRAILSRKINIQQTLQIGFGYLAAGNLVIATDNNLKMFYKESWEGHNI